MSQRGAALVMVLVTQAILALTAVQVTQHLRVQQQLLSHELTRLEDQHRLEAALNALMARLRSAPDSVMSHPHPTLGIAPNDCSLKGWLATRPERAPWQSMTQSAPNGSQRGRSVRLSWLVVDWSASGCQHRQDTTRSWHLVLRAQRLRALPEYLTVMLSGEPLAPTHRQHHR